MNKKLACNRLNFLCVHPEETDFFGRSCCSSTGSSSQYLFPLKRYWLVSSHCQRMKTKIRWEVLKMDLWDCRRNLSCCVRFTNLALICIGRGGGVIKNGSQESICNGTFGNFLPLTTMCFRTYQYIFTAIMGKQVQNIISFHLNECWACYYRSFMGLWTDVQSFLWLHTLGGQKKSPGTFRIFLSISFKAAAYIRISHWGNHKSSSHGWVR